MRNLNRMVPCGVDSLYQSSFLSPRQMFALTIALALSLCTGSGKWGVASWKPQKTEPLTWAPGASVTFTQGRLFFPPWCLAYSISVC